MGSWIVRNAARILATALPVWMLIMVFLVVMFTMIFLRTMHLYHDDLVRALEQILRNQTTSFRLAFQFIMDKQMPETESILSRLKALETHAGIVPALPFSKPVREELIDEIKHELEAMKVTSQVIEEGKEGEK